MKIKSALITQASGSIGGLTASRNKGGMYFRSRSIPTNPSSERQQIVRGLMTTLSSAWNALTEAQRDGWNLYGSETPVIDRLGDAIQLSGQQHFIRSNVPRLQNDLDLAEDAPTTWNLGTFTPPNDRSIAGDTITVEIWPTDEWANETGSILIIQQGRPQNAGVSFFNGPWRNVGAIEGDATTPPTGDNTMSGAFTTTIGQKQWLRLRVAFADGRLSSPVITGPRILSGP